jgi:putative glutamine amidotransferase
MSAKRLVSIGDYFNAKKPFADLFADVVVVPLQRVPLFEFKPTDVVLLGGGSDISPTLYKHIPSRHTGASEQLSERDMHEATAFEMAQQAGAKILGICRGAQLICAMSGGSLYQHVNNHNGGSHTMTTKEGTVLEVSSAHHQMMNPFGTKHEVLAWATEVLSNVHIVQNEEVVKVDVEPEAIYFHDTNALALQYHPEFMSMDSHGVQYSRELVKSYFL